MEKTHDLGTHKVVVKENHFTRYHMNGGKFFLVVKNLDNKILGDYDGVGWCVDHEIPLEIRLQAEVIHEEAEKV